MLLLLLIIIYLSYLSIGMPYTLPGAAWPVMYGGMAVPDSWLGSVSMILMIFNIIANMYCGKLLRSFNPGGIIAASIFMIGASLVGIAWSGTFVFLCIYAVPIGLGMGFVDAIVNNYVAVHFKSRHMSWLLCCWGVGATASPVVLSYGITRFGSWRWSYFSIGGVQIGLSLILILALPLWKQVSGAAEHTKELIKVKFGTIIRLRGIKLALAAFFCYCSIEMIVCVWGCSYLVMVKNVPEEAAARLISFYLFGMTISRLFFGFLTFALSNHQLIRLGCAVLVLGVAIMSISSGEILYISGFFLMGAGCAPVFPCLMHDTPKHFGVENSQYVVGLQLVSSNIGCAVAPFLFGAATEYIGYGTFPLFLGVFLAIMAVVIETLKKRILPE